MGRKEGKERASELAARRINYTDSVPVVPAKLGTQLIRSPPLALGFARGLIDSRLIRLFTAWLNWVIYSNLVLINAMQYPHGK